MMKPMDKGLVLDRKGKKVNVGDHIKFTYPSEHIYQVDLVNGKLGCYEDGTFISLLDILRNFEVVISKRYD